MEGEGIRMSTSYSVLCSDFYVNQKLALKLDVPSSRETVLHMFDRVRKEHPRMDRFRRYEDELALESHEIDREYTWMALKQTSIRSGSVNPDSLDSAYRLHRMILDVAPCYLSISPLDVDHLELVYGFDLEATTNRDEAVFTALWGDSPLASLVNTTHESILDAQPFIGFSLTESCDLQAFVEVKTRGRAIEVASGRFAEEPISVYLTVRRQGPLRGVDDFVSIFGALAGHGERLAEERVIPYVVMPIREALMNGTG
jgi:hypothetical protein